MRRGKNSSGIVSKRYAAKTLECFRAARRRGGFMKGCGKHFAQESHSKQTKSLISERMANSLTSLQPFSRFPVMGACTMFRYWMTLRAAKEWKNLENIFSRWPPMTYGHPWQASGS